MKINLSKKLCIPLLFLMVVGWPGLGFAKKVWFSLPKLVESTDLIVVAKCTLKKDVKTLRVKKDPETQKTRITKRVKAVLAVEKLLKGEWPLNKPLIFQNEESNYWREDATKLPSPGARVLLFLAREEDGSLWFVNGNNGIKFLDADKEGEELLKEVEDLIAKKTK